jgi:hypothetical protein
MNSFTITLRIDSSFRAFVVYPFRRAGTARLIGPFGARPAASRGNAGAHEVSCEWNAEGETDGCTVDHA